MRARRGPPTRLVSSASSMLPCFSMWSSALRNGSSAIVSAHAGTSGTAARIGLLADGVSSGPLAGVGWDEVAGTGAIGAITTRFTSVGVVMPVGPSGFLCCSR